MTNKITEALKLAEQDHFAGGGKPITCQNLQPVINWLENGCDPKEAAKELRIYQEQMKAAPVSAPEQEPVAIVDAFQIRQLAYELPTGTKLYAAPVSAKREWVDLTPIELAEAFSDKGSADAGIRAVIAAFKEKNK